MNKHCAMSTLNYTTYISFADDTSHYGADVPNNPTCERSVRLV